MDARGVFIEQEQSPIRGHRNTVEITGENTPVRLAVQELEQYFHKQIQKIKTLLEDGVVADEVSNRREKKVAARRGRAGRNNIKELHPPQGYRRQGQNDELDDFICPICGSSTPRGRVLNVDSRLAASYQVFDDDFLSENVKKPSNQREVTAVKESFHHTPSSNDIVMEEKLSGTDKLSSTPTQTRETNLRRSNLPRRKRGFGPLRRKKRDRYANQRANAKQLRNYKQQMLWRKKPEIPGQTEEADQKERSELFECSPLLIPTMEQQHWSDALGDSSYSDESASLMELSAGKMFIGTNSRSNSGSEDANTGSQFPRDPYTNSWSSSSSVIECRDYDFFMNNSSRHSQIPGRQRGRLVQRSGTTLRNSERGHAWGLRLSLEPSRVQSLPTALGKSGRMPRIKLGYSSLKKSKKIRKANINARPSVEILNSEKNALVPLNLTV